MTIDHQMLVVLAKSYGLFILIGASVAVLIYAFWPSNRKRFDDAARGIIDDGDEPCR